MSALRAIWERVLVESTRRFSAFTLLAGVLAVLGVVQLFTNRPGAFESFGGAVLTLVIREILRRSVP